MRLNLLLMVAISLAFGRHIKLKRGKLANLAQKLSPTEDPIEKGITSMANKLPLKPLKESILDKIRSRRAEKG